MFVARLAIVMLAATGGTGMVNNCLAEVLNIREVLEWLEGGERLG